VRYDHLTLSSAFRALMENHVIPYAVQDAGLHIREALSRNKRVRHVSYMYRKKVAGLFQKYVAVGHKLDEWRGIKVDKNSNLLSIAAWFQMITDLDEFIEPKDAALLFAQSQSEESDTYEEQDVEMSEFEFTEALLRIAEKRHANESLEMHKMFLELLLKLFGRLDGHDVKLDYSRIEDYIQDARQKFNEGRKEKTIRNMWDQFITAERSARRRSLGMFFDLDKAYNKALPAVEQVGDEKASAARTRVRVGASLIKKKTGFAAAAIAGLQAAQDSALSGINAKGSVASTLASARSGS